MLEICAMLDMVEERDEVVDVIADDRMGGLEVIEEDRMEAFPNALQNTYAP